MLIRVGKYEFLTTKENLLGSGSYGQVYRCKKIDTQEEYCVKVVNKANIKESVAKSLKRETDILQQIQTQNCDNLVQTYDVIDQQDYLYIIMEICDYDLSTEFDILKKQNTWYTENDQIEIIQQTVKGFQSLYQMNIIHRDIKPQNILVKIIHKGTLQQKKTYKITDFGFSRFLDDLMKKGNFTRVGTPSFAAPQLYFDNDFSGRCDIFSYGVVFYILAHQGQSLTPPKASMNQIKNFLLQLKTNPVKCQIQEGRYKLQLSNLIERMLAYSEDDRINFEEIFKDPVMKIELDSNTEDSIFLHILKPEQQYLQDKMEDQEKEKINSRLERVHQILSVFHCKFLFFQNTIKQLQTHLNNIHTRAVALYLYQLGYYQLTYAMGMINVNISDIHKSFKEDNDILHLLEILEECKIAVQNNFKKKQFREKISLDFLLWKKEMIQYNDEFQKYQHDQQKSEILETYLGYSKEVLAKRFSEQQILASLTTLIKRDLGFPQKLQQQLLKACNLEILFPIEKYLNINLDEIFDIL